MTAFDRVLWLDAKRLDALQLAWADIEQGLRPTCELSQFSETTERPNKKKTCREQIHTGFHIVRTEGKHLRTAIFFAVLLSRLRGSAAGSRFLRE